MCFAVCVTANKMSLNFKLFGILENIFFYSGRPVIIVHDNGLSPGQPGLISSEACLRYWWATSHCCNLSRKEHEGHVEKNCWNVSEKSYLTGGLDLFMRWLSGL